MNEKGGSGKTTLAVHCAAFFALQKRRALLVDMDPQGHAGKAMGKDVNSLPATLLEALVGSGVGLARVLQTTAIAGLDLAPCNKTMSDFALNAFRHPDRHLKLSHTLREAAAYDAVFIDSPPSLSLLTINILMAAEEIVIPVSCTYLALDGCAEILKTIKKLKSHFPQKKLDVVLVVPTLYRDTPVARAVVERLRRHFGPRLSAEVVPLDDTVDQAQSYGQTLFQFAPESLTTRSFTQIGSRLLAGAGPNIDSFRRPDVGTSSFLSSSPHGGRSEAERGGGNGHA